MIRRMKHAFRMPLNPPDKGFPVYRDCFNKPVIRFCHDRRSRCGKTDPLMVQTVHFQRACRNQLVQRGARTQIDLVDRFVMGELLTVRKRCPGL